MSNILGATTEELVTLAGRLGTTTDDIATVSTDTQGIADRVVSEMEASFAHAISGITAAMTMLRGSVDGAASQLSGTTWTGANRVTFEGAYGDFNAAMGQLETAVNDAYMQFDGQLKQIGAVITEFRGHVCTALADAQSSTTSMQTAVDQQRDSLETVMNTGFAVGS